MKAWIAELDGGKTRDEIRGRFIANDEFQGGRVNAIIAQGCLP